jgi:hypothetical protein
MPDAYVHALPHGLVIAPSDKGRLAFLAERRHAVLNPGTGEREHVLARWIFADLPQRTLRDQWGNPYDHQVHSLIVGTVAQGRAFAAELVSAGFSVTDEPKLFVPLQTVAIHDPKSSDALREKHARAFALAIRRLPPIAELVMAARDAALVGG